MLAGQRAPRPPSTCRASSPTTSRRCAGRGLLRGAARPQGPHAGRHARAAPRPRTDLARHRAGGPDGRPSATCETYKIGREVEVEDAGEERAILSLIGPRGRAVAGAPPPPSTPARRRRSAASSASSSAPSRRRPDRAAPTKPSRLRDALLDAGAAEVDAGGRRDRPHRERPAALRRRDEHRDDARRGRDRRRRRQLHQGLLHRPGAGRPPPSPGPPNRHLRGLRLDGPADGRRRPAPRRQGGRRVGSVCVSPAHGPIALAIVRREAEPGAELAVGEDGVTARVVDLPFG